MEGDDEYPLPTSHPEIESLEYNETKHLVTIRGKDNVWAITIPGEAMTDLTRAWNTVQKTQEMVKSTVWAKNKNG